MRLRLQIPSLNFGTNLAGVYGIFFSGNSLIKWRTFQRAKRRWRSPLPVQAAGRAWGNAGSQGSCGSCFLQNWGQQNLPLSGCAADCLITDIHGGFGALRMGMPCANANVTACSTTWGPRWLVLFYCFSCVIMFNACVVSSKCLSLRAWPHLLK